MRSEQLARRFRLKLRLELKRNEMRVVGGGPRSRVDGWMGRWAGGGWQMDGRAVLVLVDTCVLLLFPADRLACVIDDRIEPIVAVYQVGAEPFECRQVAHVDAEQLEPAAPLVIVGQRGKTWRRAALVRNAECRAAELPVMPCSAKRHASRASLPF